MPDAELDAELGAAPTADGADGAPAPGVIDGSPAVPQAARTRRATTAVAVASGAFGLGRIWFSLVGDVLQVQPSRTGFARARGSP